MGKRIIAAALFAVFFVLMATSPVSTVAQAVSGDAAAQTLDEVVELSLKHSLERQKLLFELGRLQVDLDDLRSDPNIYLPWNAARLELLKAKNLQEERLKRSVLLVEQRVRSTMAELFSNLLAMQKQLRVQENALRVLEEKFALEKRRLQAGLSTEITVELMAISLEQSTWSLQRSADSLAQLKMQFNLLTGQALQTPVALQGNIEHEVVALSIDASLAGLQNTSMGTLFELRVTFENARKHYNHIYSPNHDTHGQGALLDAVRRAKLNMQQAQLEYEYQLRTAEIGLWGKYRDVSSAEKAVEIALRELELERHRLDLEERKFAVGLTTHMNVVDQLNRTTSKEVDYYGKVFQYQKALIAFRLAEKGI